MSLIHQIQMHRAPWIVSTYAKNDNLQGGRDLLHLHTNALITRQRVTQVPNTPAIINKSISLQGKIVCLQLKITSRTCQIL